MSEYTNVEHPLSRKTSGKRLASDRQGDCSGEEDFGEIQEYEEGVDEENVKCTMKKQ